MRALLLVLTLLLPACGGGGILDVLGGLDGPSIIHVRVVSSLPNGWGGHYQRDGDEATISIRSDLVGSASVLVRTLVHELGHSMGLAHGADSTCVMYETNVSGDSWSICGHEIAAALPAPPSAVDAEAPLAAATIDAVQRWNAALGRTQFTFVP